MSPASGNRVDYRIQKLEGKLRGKCVIIIDIAMYIIITNIASMIVFMNNSVIMCINTIIPIWNILRVSLRKSI